jgi:hypothetical protein
MFVIFIYEFWSGPLGDFVFWSLVTLLPLNMISDYISLFVIRHWLAIGARRPLFAIFMGALIGSVVILLAMIFVFFILTILYFFSPLDLMLHDIIEWLTATLPSPGFSSRGNVGTAWAQIH